MVDVQPKLGARVRFLGAGDVNKNDPNEARSVAVAALRSPVCRQVHPDDHAADWQTRSRVMGSSLQRANLEATEQPLAMPIVKPLTADDAEPLLSTWRDGTVINQSCQASG